MAMKCVCDRCGFEDQPTAVGKVPRDWQILNGAAIWMRDTYLCPSCWKQFQVWIEQEKAKLFQQTLKVGTTDVQVAINAVKLLNPRDPVWGAKSYKDGKWQRYVSFTVDEPEES